MNPISPVGTISYKGTAPESKGEKKHALNFIKPKEKEENKEEQKKKFPWKKVILGAAGLSVFIGFVLSRNPARRGVEKGLQDVFIRDVKGAPRDLAMFPVRDSIIINEIANGNKAAEQFYDTIDKDAPKAVEYLKTQQKIARMKQYRAEGRLDFYETEKTSNAKMRRMFNKRLRELEQKASELYEQYIKPKIQY